MPPRRDYTIIEKLQIYSEYLQSRKSIRYFCLEKKLTKSVLQRIIKNHSKLTLSQEQMTFPGSRKRARQANLDDVDEALLRWYQIAREYSLPHSGPIMRLKAEEFASCLGHDNWHCSDGWISRWKKRHVFSYNVEEEMNKLRTVYDNGIAEVENNSGAAQAQIVIEDDDSGQRNTHNNNNNNNKEVNSEDVAQRLKELQQSVVGGEMSNNEEVKEKRKKLKTLAEENQKKLQEALEMDSDEVVVGMFKNVQDELKYKNKFLDKEKHKSEALRCEIEDIQKEFEEDRNDYLDTIRKQEKQIKLLQSLLSCMQPLIRKDCNFSNLERVKSQSQWDELNKTWTLPRVAIEASHLPPANKPSNNNTRGNHSARDNYVDDLKIVQMFKGIQNVKP